MKDLWAGKFRTGAASLVLFDPQVQEELPAFVLLYLVDECCQQKFPAAAVRTSLVAVEGPERAVAVESYRKWVRDPSAVRRKPRFGNTAEATGDRGMPWLDDWGA